MLGFASMLRAIVILTASLLLLSALPLWAAGSMPAVDAAIGTGLREKGSASFIVYLRDRAELSGAASLAWIERGHHVAEALRSVASRSQARVKDYLTRQGVPFRGFWASNVIIVFRAGPETVEGLKSFPEIRAIAPRRVIRLVDPSAEEMDTSCQSLEWNIAKIGADKVWQLGYTGQGITVGAIDTGVRYTHHALVNQYRGKVGSGFDHNFNWWDPSRICGDPSTEPCDNHGHGTHTMGTSVGSDGAQNLIGVAPGAQWISCKGCENRTCSDFALLECGEFMLAPWDLDRIRSDPAMRPHVVNNSWGGDSGDDWYQDVVDAWVAAGIYPVFSNGNTGSGCMTAGSPGDYGNVSAVGATDARDAPGAFSGRGPSVFEDTLNPFGYPFLKPQFSAPGVNIRSSVNTSDTAYQGGWSGTSMAAPHVSGLVALMWSAAPCLVRDYVTTESLIMESATPLPNDSGCGDGPGSIPNQATGWGLINTQTAVAAARSYCGVFAGVEVLLTGSGSGRVKSAPAGIDCGTQCRSEFKTGTRVRLTATADAGSVFSGWTGACAGGARTCAFRADGSLQQVVALFTSEPAIVLSRTVLDFLRVRTGSRATRYLTIANRGQKDLVVGTVAVNGTEAFSIPAAFDRCSGKVIPPRRSCSLRVVFQPPAAGPFTATIEVPSNDPDSPLSLTLLTGTGR